MEVVLAIASKIGEYLVEPTVNQVRYLFCFNTIVKELEEQENKLKWAKENVKKEVEIAKNNTDEIKGDVKEWLTDANKMLADAAGLREETGVKKTCLNGWCPSWGCRYWLARKAAKKTTIMRKLTDNGNFDGVGHRTTLPGIEFLKPHQFQIFESSKSAIDDIIEALKNDKIYMVGLYGMGGAGKTTLAKEVGNRVKEIFNEVVIVTISQTPNFKNIQGQLASELRLSLEEQGEEERARRLFKRFTEPEKKILVILDDVWRKFELKSILGIPLDDDNKNCKILLTTRRQQVCIDMGCQSRIQLNVLNDDEAVALLKRHAGIGDASNLNPLAIKIAKECDGLPLALVAIGSALREKDCDEWKVLHDKLRDSKLEDMISVTGEDSIVAGEKVIYATLKLSYDYLRGEQIQFCFLLCSLFPEDYEISLDELVRIGIGLDLYQDVNSIEDLRKQFCVMVNNLKASGLLIDASEQVVKMHDMVRDVAIWISSQGKHVFMNKSSMGLTERRKKNMLEQCTAISLMDNGSDINLLPQSLVRPRLEILLLNFGIDGVPSEFFKDMKALQVVTLIDVDPMSFKSLELLTNLQSLKLKGCKLRDISFLGKLTRLKVLELEGSSLAGKWPKELGDQLSELRVLDVRHSKLRIPRDGLRRFSQLEELYADGCFFWPSDEITSAEESWFTVCGLNSLSCLVTLSLQINNECLPNGFAFPKLERYVINMPSFAGIVPTGYKRSLSMSGIEAASLIAFGELLQNLQSLHLSEIKGLQNYFPSVDQTCFSELIYLESRSCEELICIIDTSQRQAPAAAFSNLKTLILSNMSHLEEIYKGAEPPNTFLEKLETVEISECHSMCNVCPPMLLQRFHQLKKAEIISCNKLSEVFKLEGLCQTEGENSAVLSSLESLMLWNLTELRFIWKGPVRLVSFSNLAHVEVVGCSNLKILFALSIVRRLVQLAELIISDCEMLEHIVSDYNQGDEIAEIENGKNIVLPTLVKLRLTDLPKLISFCSENYYSTCPMLQLLEVEGCPSWTTPIIVEANTQDPPEFLHLQDGNDDIIPVTLVHGLQNLEDVELIGCAVQVVFQLEGVVAERRKHKLSFPSLKNLELKLLEKLEGLCMGLSLTHVPSLQNLTNLEVDSCSRLRYIFSATLARNMMQLKYLHISNCAELEQIIVVEEEEYQAFLNNNLQPDTFRNLLEVEVKSCSKLKCLFPTTIARGLQQLEVLVVEQNFQLEEVFGHKEVAGIMEDEEIVLPRLNYLRLRALPSLTNFCPEGCHFIFPSLRKLKFQDCGATVPIFSLTGDECVHADEKKLGVLRIGDCNNLCGGISLFSCGFNNLEYLSIFSCHKLTHIFSTTFARNMLQLKILSVEDCMELQQIVVEDDDDDHPQSLFPNLSEINVKWCDKLKCVLPITMARDLQQLKVVTVAWANQLEEVFGHTDRVDVMTDNEIQLPQLDRLYLKDLPNLANFCPIGYHFIFPSLNTLIVEGCPEMNTAFSSNQQNEFVHAEAQVEAECRMISSLSSLESTITYLNCGVKVVFKQGDLAIDGQPQQISFPSLKISDLHGLEELEDLCKGSQYVLSLQNLTTLNISCCRKLTHIFSASFAQNMLQLKSLSVEGCKDLEQIVVEDDDDHLQVLFPNLSQIHVKRCDMLKCILPISIARGLQTQDRDVRQNFQLKEVFGHEEKANLMDEKVIMLPQLEELTIVDAPQLKSIFYFENVTEWYGKDIQLPKLRKFLFSGLANLISFCPENCPSTWPALEEFSIYHCPNLTMPFLDQVRVQNLMKEKLRVLRIRDCNNLCGGTSLFSCGFNNLEDSRIWNCGVKVVFQLGDVAVDGQSHQLSFPSLNNLDLHGLEELEGLCNGSKYVLSLQNLTTLSICFCHRLTHIFSPTFALNMLQLKTLSVEGCMELQQIVVEDDDDDHLQSLFPNLSKIHVKWCDKLKCVLPITMARGLQQLKVVTVAWANQLEEVFGHTDRVDVITNNEIQLPQLDELLVQDLPNLANFCPIGYHFIFPSLNTLIVERCPEMNTAFSLNQQNKFVHAEAKAPKISMKNEGEEFNLEPPIEIVCWKSDQFPKVLPLRDEQAVTQQNDIEN